MSVDLHPKGFVDLEVEGLSFLSFFSDGATVGDLTVL